jgi:hypothetical protein
MMVSDDYVLTDLQLFHSARTTSILNEISSFCAIVHFCFLPETGFQAIS